MKTMVQPGPVYNLHDDGTIHADGVQVATNFRFSHTPHWERAGKSKDGFVHFQMQGHVKAGWVQFDITEGGDKSERRVMFTLREREQLVRMRDLIDMALGQS